MASDARFLPFLFGESVEDVSIGRSFDFIFFLSCASSVSLVATMNLAVQDSKPQRQRKRAQHKVRGDDLG